LKINLFTVRTLGNTVRTLGNTVRTLGENNFYNIAITLINTEENAH